ncbi:MFS general substrate transporter [Trametes versicolor FP-101664 SS1]|uniref:MFS general substrate transporter n=1 Tax=Trametes versicolor (strain FP-101664) TaxID=717944 RepID=UPI0004622FC5|nr:MFS general substrate transporter [Trametes versicolor FP-101664 SS1]EIW59341.1 MFS general substrate transporter [Trametes versicolor FP-101664 SS1]
MSTATPPIAELPGYSADSKDVDEKKLAPSLAAETKVAPVKQSHDIYEEDNSVDPVYHAKARVLGDAFQEIGMGKYQWYLFCLTGFGWFSDNLWPIVTGLLLPPTINEFHYQGAWLKFGQALGSLAGCAFWGISSDIWGRRWAFNLTLFITGVFAMAAGASPNAVTLCSLVAVWSVGVGGNLPVDSAIFLEFIPPTHQYLLTVLSIWWAFGQLVGSLVAWPLFANFSCASADDCPRESNQGWRYFLYAMGGLMTLLFFLRFTIFHLHESPKFLMSRGRDAEAVAVVQAVARFNGVESSLTLDMLSRYDVVETAKEKGEREEGVVRSKQDTSAKARLRRTLRTFGGDHVKGLFATPKIALSTTLLILIWALIGLAFPLYNGFLPYFLATRGADFGDGSINITYRNQVILSVVGVPGALIAGWMVDLPYLGRKGTLATSSIVTGVLLFAATTARSSNALLGWNCGYSVTNNIMYGVLYAMSPEVFPAKDRGTGSALVSSANHLCGALAPIVAIYTNLTTSVPIYVAGACFILAGVLAFFIPFEPRGKASI